MAEKPESRALTIPVTQVQEVVVEDPTRLKEGQRVYRANQHHKLDEIFKPGGTAQNSGKGRGV